jgi:16S rRNA (guanine527-N7)-methyltransferase
MEFIDELMMTGVKAECARVEDSAFIERHKDKFDTIVSRATVPLVILVRYALPLIKEHAVLMSLKGGDLNDELHEANLKYIKHIKKSTVFDLHYRPTNIKNIKDKKLIILELVK